MKNSDFFDIFSFVDSFCYFSDLPSSYYWNTQVKWHYFYRVSFDDRYHFYQIYVYRHCSGINCLLYIVHLSVKRGIITVFDIHYSSEYISKMKFSPDELRKSVPFLLGKFRTYKIFLDKFALAAMVLDKEFFSCV